MTKNFPGLFLVALVTFSCPMLIWADPYPPSTLITGVAFDQSSFVRKAVGSDNWASTWGPDGHIYTTWGDGGGFGGQDAGMGVARIEGPPENFTGTNVWGTPRGFRGGKSEGILSVDGTLYMLAGPNAGTDAWSETWVQWSDDLGVTWTTSETFFTQSDGFSKPTFLNFDMDYANARDSFVYIYGIDFSQGFPVTKLSLARVPKDQIKNRSAYEFFAGLDSNNNPTWTSDVSQRQPAFVDNEGGLADSPAIIYNSRLNRYLISKTHDTNDINAAQGGLGIFEAPEPWGPWSTVVYIDDWMGSDNMYFCEFPTKWISSDGLTLWMVFSGWGFDAIAQDAYQHMKVILSLGDILRPAAPTDLQVDPG